MSLGDKVVAARALVNAFSHWPNDANKIYPSLKAAQIALYEKGSNLPPAEVLKLRTVAVNNLANNVYYDKFALSEEVMHPDGNTEYYTMVAREANKGAKKTSRLTSFKQALFGWWK